MSKCWFVLLLALGMVWFGRAGVAHAQVSATPNVVVIPQVSVDQQASATTTLSASRNIEITLSRGPGSDCQQFAATPSGAITLGPNDDATITVQFSPTTPGAKTCTFTGRDDDGGTVVSFTAVGNPPLLGLATPGPLAFADVDVGTATSRTLTVRNIGGTTLAISNAAFTSGASDYELSGATTAALAPGETHSWIIACRPTAPFARNGTFRMTSNSQSGPSSDVELTCTGRGAVLSLIPASHNFGAVRQGNAPTVDFELQNTGNLEVTELGGALDITNRGYVFNPASVPATLAAGASAPLTVGFAPQSGNDGGRAAINFAGRSGTGMATVTAAFGLDGDGLAASFAVTPAELDFGSFRFDAPPSRTFQIANTGEVTIAIQTAAFTPDPGTATTEYDLVIRRGSSVVVLPQSLVPSEQLQVTVTPRPSNRIGVVSGRVDVTSNVAGAPGQRVTLSGTSTAAILVATSLIDFGAVDIDGPERTQDATISNTGTAPLELTSLALVSPSGTAGALTVDPALPSGPIAIAAGESRSFVIRYKPTVQRMAGDSDGIVLLARLTGGGVIDGPTEARIPISGRGIDRTLVILPPPQFPSTFRNPGDSAPVLPVTVQNHGEAPLRISAVMLSGGSSWQLLNGDAVTVPGRTSQIFQHDFMIRFAPTMADRLDAVLTIVNDDNGQPMAMVPLRGTGIGRNVMLVPQTVIQLGFTGVGLPISATGVLEVSNGDVAPFTIRAITLTGDPGFRIDNPPAMTALPASSSARFDVTFTPTQIGHFETVAQLFLDQDGEPQAEVRITGDAVFVDAHGGGGCSAGGSPGSPGGGAGGALIALGLVGALRLAFGRRRRHLTVAAGAATATAMLAAAAPAVRADDVDLAVFAPTPATTNTGFQLQSPEVGTSGSWAIDSTASYASNLLILDGIDGQRATTARNAPVEHSTRLQLGAAVALLDWIEAGVQLPLYMQSGERASSRDMSGRLPVTPADGTALGNLSIHVKAQLWRAGGLALGATTSVQVPTATAGQYTGSDQLAARLLVLGAFTPEALRSRLSLAANAGAIVRGTTRYLNVEQKSGIAWGVGASFRVLDSLSATAELFGEAIPSGRRSASDAMTMLSPSEWLAGVRFRPDRRVTIGVAGGRGLTSALGTPDIRGVVSLAFVPGAPVIAPIRGAASGPDVDSDGDSVGDRADRCRNEPEDADLFEDSDGCPEFDNDRDGIPDLADECALDAEDEDSFQDSDGCPDKDNDGDGISDAIDACRGETEDRDGFEDADGCPELDNDRDGLADATDKCPSAPETINGITDEDGCPDKGDTTIVMSPDQIETLDPIQFNGLRIARPSLAVLAQVAATLRAQPGILRVRITAHVHPTKDPVADQARSDRRAQVIRDWLVQWGIAPSRLDVRGFGGSKPLVSRDQRGAAKINERIEFIILERN